MLIRTGIVTQKLLEKALPSPERRAQGPYAMIECFQEIPCNPCSISCPFHAILPMEDINELPRLVPDLCTGCGICAGVCPGLAIFIIDESKGDEKGHISIPYEFSPLPQKGDVVMAVDREGNPVEETQVVRVVQSKKIPTPLVTLEVSLSKIHGIRFFQPIKNEENIGDDRQIYPTTTIEPKEAEEDTLKMADETIACRCEGITLGDIRRLIREGYTTVDEIKRISRAGMGPCQARTCGPLIAQEIARMTGVPIEDVDPSLHRPPTKSLPIAFFMEDN